VHPDLRAIPRWSVERLLPRAEDGLAVERDIGGWRCTVCLGRSWAVGLFWSTTWARVAAIIIASLSIVSMFMWRHRHAAVLDPEFRTGWTLVVVGLAHTITDPDLISCYERPLHPWVNPADTVIGMSRRRSLDCNRRESGPNAGHRRLITEQSTTPNTHVLQMCTRHRRAATPGEI